MILGASGLAGNAILNLLAKEHDVYGTYFSRRAQCASAENMFYLDVASGESFARIIEKTTPQIIVSCLCGDFERQLALHKKAAEYLLTVNGGKLIYLSTANVFDGLDTLPHYENDTPSSQSDYGQFKISCETLLTAILGENAIILRLPFVWGKTSPRLKQVIQGIQAGAPIKVWSNLFANHTTDLQIAGYVDMIIRENRTGIFHVGSDAAWDYMSFIKALIDRLGLPLPRFEVEEMPYPCYLALLSAREDIPIGLHMTNEDILNALTA